jgi:hypothetical protein
MKKTKRGTTFMKSTAKGHLTNAKNLATQADAAPQMQSALVDMTHDVLPEIKWRPIKKIPEEIPSAEIVNEKVNLQNWEMAMNKAFYAYTYNRIYADNEVFKQFISNGNVIKMLVDPRDLQGATAFWKNEEDITKLAKKYMAGLRKRKAYDFHDINPEAYDLRADKNMDVGKAPAKSKGGKKGGGDLGAVGEAGEDEEDDDVPAAKKVATNALPGFENDETAALLKAKASGLAVNKQ